MIHYRVGNIFDSEAVALVNTVNLLGVMGKGVALQFKTHFPNNYKIYRTACKNNEIAIGKLLVVEDSSMFGKKLIVNFPTKTDWRKSSEYVYIEQGLDDLVRVIKKYQISSIALPPLGAGNGGLNWNRVKAIINEKLSAIDCEIFVYEPNAKIKEQLNAERVKLTDARALLLYLLFDLVRQGEDVSEFSSEKVCYFLQKFGAKDIFKLDYKAEYYGPYSGKVRHLLNMLNGSYIMGYSDMDKKPFDPLFLVKDTYDVVNEYIENDSRLKEIGCKTKSFLDGYYSDFSLELLSSLDFLINHNLGVSFDTIYQLLCKWNKRKESMFEDEKCVKKAYDYITIANKGSELVY